MKLRGYKVFLWERDTWTDDDVIAILPTKKATIKLVKALQRRGLNAFWADNWIYNENA